ncbi:GMC family oxidoreductase N-terminal domain-containing protein [Polymorphobacter sp. PAMC 29334]|uniref:GMC family oxidoreductase n=1 Tax=Polymorphobacter sp. PAMC 29334 TaxID=2862331 RepID=UPI001C775CF1|nr:GMC family oxidoreductase N-terminal domain-containing protein [Polymorphobacter sp. PAMC 29334]QYE35646.1 GMC family oxidoreductase N-terminal domain-containing protein [Polymorphobacter sp. PAMC 29334]
MEAQTDDRSVAYDVIVVGAGSAGCIVAGRLAAETEARVLVLEDGGRDWSPLISIPAGFSKLLEYGQFMYPYETVAQQHLGGRRIPLVQGRGLGGSGSINAMVWVIGQPRDYDAWQVAAGDGSAWSFADVLPHFRAMEGNEVFAGPTHGADGPVTVSQPLAIAPINRAVLKAFQQVGLPYNPDYNGGQQRGVGPCQLNVANAERCSSAHAYLHPAETRPNLTVRTGALVTRVIVEGDRAIGVELMHSGVVERVYAAEIVLCAGALSTPRLLMLSGIGPEAELARHGIPVAVRSEGVGENLHDHPEVPVIAQSYTEMGYLKDSSLFGAFKAGLRYIGTKSGPASSNGIETVAHFNPEFPDQEPTVQCFHAPVIARRALGQLDPEPGLTLENVVLQPKSRGRLTLKDADPKSMALIDPNYLSHPDDMRTMLLGLRYAREVLNAPALKAVLKPELLPGAAVQSDADLTAYARENMSCMLHPVGTCRMGCDDGAVVDASLRVRGVRGLRVIDASIMPNIVSGNTNAAVMALAHKGTDMMLAEIAP